MVPTSDAPFDEGGDGDGDGDGGGGGGTEAGDDGDVIAGPDAAGATRTVTPPIDPVHGLPTQQLGRRAAAARAGTDSAASRYSTTASPVEAMRLEEMARTRIFLKVAILTVRGGRDRRAVATGGDPIAFWVVVAGCDRDQPRRAVDARHHGATPSATRRARSCRRR